MKLTHRMRMRQLNYSADRLLSRARREHANRPHIPSVFMISHPIPRTPRQHGITPLYVLLLVILFGLIGYLNTGFK